MPGLLNSKNRNSRKNRAAQRAETEPDTVDESAEGAEEEEETEDPMPEEEAGTPDEDDESMRRAGASAERTRIDSIQATAKKLGLALDSDEVRSCVNRGLSVADANELLIDASASKPKPKGAPAGATRMGSAATQAAARVTPTMSGDGGGGAMPQPATFAEAITEQQEAARRGGMKITRARAARLAADLYPDLYRSENESVHRKMPRGAKDPTG